MRSSIVTVQRDQVTHRWINPENQRYYSVRLEQDLFGDWTLVACWGGLNSKLGGLKISRVDSEEQGLEEITKIAKRRRQRGYDELVQDEHPWESLSEDLG